MSSDEYMVLEIAKRPRQVPRWAARSFVFQDGRVFLPAALSPAGEQWAFLAATWESESVFIDGKHVYVNVDFLIREYPDHAEEFRRIKQQNLDQVRKDWPDSWKKA